MDTTTLQPEGPANDAMSARADWENAAPKPSDNMPDVSHVDSGAPSPQVSEQPQQQAPQTVPVPVTSMKRPGILGVLDSVADALVGTQRPELGKDPQGNIYVKQHDLTRGDQWRRIAGEAMVGAAAGLAAGKGAGNKGKAALAGVQSEQQMQDREQKQFNDEIDQTDKITLANANNQMLRMRMAEEAWKATRNQVEASQHDIDFAQKQEDRLLTKEAGGKLLGTVGDPSEISSVLKINPTLAEDMIKHHLIELVPHINPDGSRGGFKVIKMPVGYREQVVPPGATFHTFDQTTGQYVEHKTSDPTTQGELDDYETAAGLAAMKHASDLAEQKLKGAQTQEALGHATEVPSVIEKNQASAERDRAEATKVPSEIAKNNATADKEHAAMNGGTEGNDGLVDLVGTGRAGTQRIEYLLARNPALLSQVTKKYPDFDVSKVGSYVAMAKEFTGKGKVAQQLNSGSTALLHLAELDKLNTVASHIPGTPDYNRYMNKADTVAHELAQFYGNTTIPAIEGIKKTIASQLPGTRHAAIQEQARSMGDKFNEFEATWKRGVPSKAYEPLMPQLSEASKEARAYLDPAYRKQLVAEKQKEQQQQAATPPKAPVIGEPAIEEPIAPARPNAPQPAAAAQTHVFSIGAWKKANPNGNAEAAKAEAQRQGLQVID